MWCFIFPPRSFHQVGTCALIQSLQLQSTLEIIYFYKREEGQCALDGEEIACHPLWFGNASQVSAGLSALEAMPTGGQERQVEISPSAGI